MPNRTTKQRYTTAVILYLLMAALFTGCSSGTTTSPKEEVKTTIEDVVETKVEEKEETAEIVPEPTTEVAAEEETVTVSEPIVYEGIDMESTLPGVEWIETFVGIIDEPKFVVFNDDTNKKVIVEDGQIVSFERTDTIAVYLPDGVREITSGGGLVEKQTTNEHSCIITKLRMDRLEKESKRLKKKGGAEFYFILDNKGKEEQLDCRISLVE